jgi:hypothetical protein
MMWRCIVVTNTATETPAKSASFTPLAPLTSINVSSQFEIKCVVLVTELCQATIVKTKHSLLIHIKVIYRKAPQENLFEDQ